MPSSIQTRAEDVRALAGAIVLGSSAGLVVGVAYLAGSGGKVAARVVPAPAASGPLQATAHPVVRVGGAPVRLVSVASAATKTNGAPIQPDLALRDRFRVAVQAFHAAAQPFHFQKVADAPSDLHCLTEAVYFEARGEGSPGQQAVAQVVLNRVRHPAFPKTICAVVHQHAGSSCQFSFACSSRQSPIEAVAWRRAEAIASGEMHGAVMAAVGDATQFQAARASPFAGLLKVAQVGAHIFYRFGGHAGAPAMFHQTPAASAEPATIELARLEPAPAIKAAQPVLSDGRIKVTLYPAPETLPSVKPEMVKPVSTFPAEAKSPPALTASSSPAPPATPPAKGADDAMAKPAIISVALAQS